jgi:cation diffusion facilitator family transporter
MEKSNYKSIRNILWLILFLNFGVAAVKIVVGSMIRSASLTADGYHSLTDGSSNIVGLIGLFFASRPVDAGHPYGHNKFETLTGIFIAVMLTVIGVKVILDALSRFANPVTPEVTLVSLLSLLGTLAVNVFVSTYELRAGRRLGSYILVSDSLHTRSDIFVSVGVLASLVGIYFFHLPAWIDPVVSLVVAGFILWAAFGILRSASDILVDKAAVDTEKVRAVVLEFDSVKGIHEIRSRGAGDSLFLDMHILTDPDMTVQESHELIHHIEKHIQEAFGRNASVIVHLEPFGADEDPKID